MKDLRDTTMDPARRALLRVAIVSDPEGTADSVERLMGVKPEPRFAFIEAALAGRGRAPAQSSLEEMDGLWKAAKQSGL